MNTLMQLTGEQLSGTMTGTEEIVAHVVDTTSDIVTNVLPIDVLHGLSTSFSSLSIPFYVIVFLWILTIIWVIKDSNYRSSSIGFVVFSLFLVTIGTPVIGLPLYFAIRPLGYKYERAYWKAIMTQDSFEEDEVEVMQANSSREYWQNKYKSSSDQTWQDKSSPKREEQIIAGADEDHLASLKKQATVAKRRVTRAAHTSETKKTTPSSPPKAKKPNPRRK